MSCFALKRQLLTIAESVREAPCLAGLIANSRSTWLGGDIDFVAPWEDDETINSACFFLHANHHFFVGWDGLKPTCLFVFGFDGVGHWSHDGELVLQGVLPQESAFAYFCQDSFLSLYLQFLTPCGSSTLQSEMLVVNQAMTTMPKFCNWLLAQSSDVFSVYGASPKCWSERIRYSFQRTWFLWLYSKSVNKCGIVTCRYYIW